MNTHRLDDDTDRAVHDFVGRLSERFDVAGAIVFGSRAHGTHRPDSDTDVAVILRGAKGAFFDTKMAMADLAYEILLDTGVLIQPLPVWEDEWAHPESSPNPALLRNIERGGIRV